jgi:hypothetical protein
MPDFRGRTADVSATHVVSYYDLLTALGIMEEASCSLILEANMKSH